MEQTDTTRGDLVVKDKALSLQLTPLGTLCYIWVQLRTGKCSILKGAQFWEPYGPKMQHLRLLCKVDNLY